MGSLVGHAVTAADDRLRGRDLARVFVCRSGNLGLGKDFRILIFSHKTGEVNQKDFTVTQRIKEVKESIKQLIVDDWSGSS